MKERRSAYLRLAHMKRQILALWSMYLMQPQEDIDELELEAIIKMLLYLLFQWLATDELWVTYGPGKNVQNIPAHAIAMSLGPDKASTPPMFHALTGCDTVSLFGGRGKKRLGMCGKCFLN